MKKIKHLLKRIPVLYTLFQSMRAPKQELSRWRVFLKFYQRYKKILSSRQQGSHTSGEKTLVISLSGDSITTTLMEAFFVKALMNYGVEPIILTERGTWNHRYYRFFGVKKFCFFSELHDQLASMVKDEEVAHAMPKITDTRSMMAYAYRGVKIGKYIASSLIRKTYTGTIDFDDLKMRSAIAAALQNSMVTTHVVEKVFLDEKPTSVLFLERGYTPFGEFFDVAIRHKLNIVQWCGSQADSALMLKRYHVGNTDQHPASLSHKTWEILKKMPWDDEKSQRIQQELFSLYSSGSWFSEVGTQFHTKIVEKEKICHQLGLDPHKKIAVIFPHLFWDGTFFWGVDLFANYREWFMESVKAACKNSAVQWIIKIHPANMVKLSRDGYKGEYVEMTAIREAVGELPAHIKVLEPSTKISTYSLFSTIDYCVTVRGTVGIEAAMFGIPVITAGTGRYDEHGFTIDSHSTDEYLHKLAHIQTFSRLTEEQKQDARKFAYGTFLLRPFRLKTMEISYKKDAKATQQVIYHFRSKKELENAPDMARFADWFLNSRDDDYLEEA